MKISTIICPDCKREITVLVPQESDPINGKSFDVIVYDEAEDKKENS